MAAFEYDCRNRLVKITDEQGEITEYEYDAEDTRIAVIQNDVRTEYVVDKNTTYSQILTETTYEKTLLGYKKQISTKDYIYGLGLISEQQDGKANYYHYNNLGSTTEVTADTGELLYSFAYGPYGELTGISQNKA